MRANILRHLEDCAGAGQQGCKEESCGPTTVPFCLALCFFWKLPRQKLCVWDPFCGKGTLLLEALGIAMGVPPASPESWQRKP